MPTAVRQIQCRSAALPKGHAEALEGTHVGAGKVPVMLLLLILKTVKEFWKANDHSDAMFPGH